MLRRELQKHLSCHVPLRLLRRLKLPHPVGIVIGDGVKVGHGVRIYQNVTIGRLDSAASGRYPTIGDEVTVYAGAVIAGEIRVGARSIIGANAVVTRDVPEDSLVIGFNRVRHVAGTPDSA